MKKIIKITLDNYKGYIQKETIKLPKGENLLIYGENGSGKSSLFNALRHFLQSSRDQSTPFDLNVFSSRLAGSIELTFQDYDSASQKMKDGTVASFIACETPANSTNTQPFIQLGHRLSGFLDYSQLLKVYLNQGTRPNLFGLINDLIGDYVPTAHGIFITLKELIDDIHNKTRNSYQRSNRSYKEGKHKFSQLSAAYGKIIGELDREFSTLMLNYFPEFKLGLHLTGTTISLDEDCQIRDTQISGSIYIDVKHSGMSLKNYNTRLNEARLSAIAICLYLASLKLRNRNSDVKLLYLDDVFIGLDSANRRPILNILDKEFSDYQIIISTYDKSWYSLAKEILYDTQRWKHIEFYEGETNIAGRSVVRPIIVEGFSFIDKAKVYLFDQSNPDYPAAANYMRKAFEELLSKKMYPSAVKDNNLENIPGYKIPALINRSKVFLSCLPYDSSAPILIGLLDQLTTYLKPMLHPLSHYAPGQPVYKKELTEALDIYDKISNYLKVANYRSKLKPLLTRGAQCVFTIKGTDWENKYVLQAEYDMFSYPDAGGGKHVSSCRLKLKKVIETDTKTNTSKSRDVSTSTKKPPIHEYNSIEHCATELSTFLKSPDGGKPDCNVLTPITDMFFLPKIHKTPKPEVKYTCVLTSKL